MAANDASAAGFVARLSAILDSVLGGRARRGKVGREDAIEPQSADIEFQKYVCDRAHELELNKFVHVFELERLKILSILNGGAVGIAAGFSEALAKGEGPTQWLAGGAVVSWVLGLLVATWAIQVALKLQANFAQAYRYRRHSIEWRLLSGKYPSMPQRTRVLSPPPLKKRRLVIRKVMRWSSIKVGFYVWRGKIAPEEAHLAQIANEERANTVDLEFNRLADDHKDTGSRLQPKVEFWALMSVLLFAAGAGFMLAAIASMPTPKSTPDVSVSLQVGKPN